MSGYKLLTFLMSTYMPQNPIAFPPILICFKIIKLVNIRLIKSPKKGSEMLCENAPQGAGDQGEEGTWL